MINNIAASGLKTNMQSRKFWRKNWQNRIAVYFLQVKQKNYEIEFNSCSYCGKLDKYYFFHQKLNHF